MRAALCLCFALALSSCGGTSSDTPWPIEPDEQPLGPTAESTAPDLSEAAVVDPGPAPEEEPEVPDGGAPARKKAPPER
ncbi:MAG: hypothetical protein WKG00_14590 [Polyangiaceae bacterium]